jgi:hypothetical protein
MPCRNFDIPGARLYGSLNGTTLGRLDTSVTGGFVAGICKDSVASVNLVSENQLRAGANFTIVRYCACACAVTIYNATRCLHSIYVLSNKEKTL